MEKLGLPIEPWVLKRKVVIGTRFLKSSENDVKSEFLIDANGVDPDNPSVSMTLFKESHIKLKDGSFVDFEGESIAVSDVV